jgi:hypothetical protein
MAVVTLWMGVGSPYLTRRTATATDTIRQQMVRPGDVAPQEASRPAERSGVKISFGRVGTLACADQSDSACTSQLASTQKNISLERSGTR